MAGVVTRASVAVGILISLVPFVTSSCQVTGAEKSTGEVLAIFPKQSPYQQCCQVIKASSVKQPEKIQYDKAEGDKFYMLVMSDPDAPHPSFVHWVIVNVKGDKVKEGFDKDDGETAIKYFPPKPPGEQHRYHLFLFQQNGEVADDKIHELDQLKRAPWKVSDILTKAGQEPSSVPVANYQFSAFASTRCTQTQDTCAECKK